jgi:hypothetical protein
MNKLRMDFEKLDLKVAQLQREITNLSERCDSALRLAQLIAAQFQRFEIALNGHQEALEALKAESPGHVN